MDIKTDEKPSRNVWWCNERFTILPLFTYKKANYHNTTKFSFRWLILKLWTIDAFDFEFAAFLDNHFGIGFSITLPYTRIVVSIEPRPKINEWIQSKLWRKPASMRKNGRTIS